MHRVPVPAILLLAVSLWCVAASSSWADGPARATDFEQRVPAARVGATTSGAGAARGTAAGATRATTAGWRTTPPLSAPHRFDLLGVRWRGAAVHVELRVQRRDGDWSRWVQAPPAEQPPAAWTGATQSAGPVWTGGGQRYQVRFTGPVHDARVHFVAVRRSGLAPLAQPAAGGRPAIVPRSAWDPGNDCPPRVTPIYGRVDFGIVHHTVSLNGYGPSSTPAIVLGICRFHRNGNGWNDIGYNLLVDRYGRVFEGRAGGIEQPVIGAHAQGWNSVSTGVAAIGEFSGAGAPSGMLSAIARVLAWKLGLAGVPALGSVREVSIGGELNRWPERARVTFQRVSGHRDGGLTDCPGGALYAQLPALRELVQRALPAPRDLLTISPAPAAQPAGRPVFLTGRLARADGRRPSGQPIVLELLQDDVWTAIDTVTTGADGIWTAELPLAENAQVRARHEASGLVSPVVTIPLQAGVRVRTAVRTFRLGRTIELTGATSPVKGAVRVSVEQRVSERPLRFRRVRLRTVATVDGRFALTLRLPAAGAWRVIARTRTDAVNAAGSSRALRLRVLPRG